MKSWLIQKAILWLLKIQSGDFQKILDWVQHAEWNVQSGGSEKRQAVLDRAKIAFKSLFKPDGKPSFVLNAAIEIALLILRRK